MASIIIRDALLSDIETCGEIELSAAQRFASLDNPKINAIANDTATLNPETLAKSIQTDLCFISEIEQKAVGFIALTQFGNSWYIEELCVVEHAQSQGVGSGLLAYVKMLAEIKRIPSINLITFKDVVWNQPFYSKKGYISMPKERLSEQFLTLWQLDNTHFEAGLRVCMQLKIDIDKF